MERDGQKCAKAEEGERALFMRFSDHRCPDRESVDQRVQREAQRQAEPTERVLAAPVIVVLMMFLAWPFVRMMRMDQIAGVAMLVRVNVKDANQEEHRNQTAERPADNPVD